MNLALNATYGSIVGIPRVSGGEPKTAGGQGEGKEYSPRERG